MRSPSCARSGHLVEQEGPEPFCVGGWPRSGRVGGRSGLSTRAVPGTGSSAATCHTSAGLSVSSTSRSRRGRGPATPCGQWPAPRCRGGASSTSPHDHRPAGPATANRIRGASIVTAIVATPCACLDERGTGIPPLDLLIRGGPAHRAEDAPGCIDQSGRPRHTNDLAANPPTTTAEGSAQPRKGQTSRPASGWRGG